MSIIWTLNDVKTMISVVIQVSDSDSINCWNFGKIINMSNLDMAKFDVMWSMNAINVIPEKSIGL